MLKRVKFVSACLSFADGWRRGSSGLPYRAERGIGLAYLQKYGTTINAVASANNIPSSYLIYPGQVLIIPGSIALHPVKPSG